jgi:hypothetical protein
MVQININDVSDPDKRLQLVKEACADGGLRTFVVRTSPSWDAFKVSRVEWEGVFLGTLANGLDGFSGAHLLAETSGLILVNTKSKRRIGYYYNDPHVVDEQINCIIGIPTSALLDVREEA